MENLHRRQLTELERDEAYKELYDLIKQERSGIYKEHIVNDMAKKIEELTGEKPSEKPSGNAYKSPKNCQTALREF